MEAVRSLLYTPCHGDGKVLVWFGLVGRYAAWLVIDTQMNQKNSRSME
jgi:hypothetical protein